MAMPPISQIGPLRFIGWTGPPLDRPSPEVEVISRPGVNGVGFRDLGRRGRPFQIQTGVDLAYWGLQHAYLEEARALIESDPVEVVWLDKLIIDILYKVVDVQLVVSQKIESSAGGINAPSYMWVELLWTLVAIDKEGPEE